MHEQICDSVSGRRLARQSLLMEKLLLSPTLFRADKPDQFASNRFHNW